MKEYYIIVDGASKYFDSQFFVENSIELKSLFKVPIESTLNVVSPKLSLQSIYSLDKSNILLYLSGKAFFIILEYHGDFEIIYNHFRRLIIVENEDDFTKLYFRFYDPRVLRIFLPTCSANQLEELFGPVDRFICEDEDADFALVFSLSKGKLITEKTKWNILFPIWVPNENQASLTGHLPPNSVKALQPPK